MIVRRPPDLSDFEDVLLDEETNPRILGIDDLDRQGCEIPRLHRVLTAGAELNAFTDGMT